MTFCDKCRNSLKYYDMFVRAFVSYILIIAKMRNIVNQRSMNRINTQIVARI